MITTTTNISYNRLLERQVNKYIPKDLQNNPDILNFLNSVNSSYKSFERDITLTNHSFSLSEKEYIEINKILKQELDIKKESICKLNETVSLIADNEQFNYSGDLLEIVDYLNQQVNKRKESEKFLSTIIENLPKGLLLQNDEGKILYVNQSFCNIFDIKISPSDVKSIDYSKCNGSTYYSLGDVNSIFSDEEAFIAAINAIEQKREINPNEIIEFKNGRIFERSYVPIFIDKEFHGHFWSYHEITELQRANETIRNNFEILAQCQRIAKLGICEVNFTTKKTYWNDEFFIARGLAAQEQEPDFNLFLQCVHPDDSEKFMDENGEQKKYLDHQDIIYRIIKPDGTTRVMHDISETVYDKLKKPIRISHISRDITEQINNEEEIINQRKFTEDILNSLPVDIAVFDLQHNYLFLNPKAIGNDETRKWLIGKNDFDYCRHKNVSDTMAKKRRNYFNNTIKNNISEEWVDEHVRKDGETDYILRSFFPYSQNNTLKFVIGYGVDISKVKRAEATIKLAMEMKEKTNSNLEQFAFAISHDLQEPLRTVTGFLGILEVKYFTSLDETAQKYIQFAVDGAKRMKQKIQELLEYSRIEKTENVTEEIDVMGLTNEIIQLLSRQIKEKNAIISFVNLPIIYAYKAPVMQILQNLISNALKYQSMDNRPEITISANDLINQWEFQIKDNGIGINAAFFDKIFVIFQRLHLNEQYSGTGVGLAITKKMIESMGGKIWVESEEGKGSIFYFTIPKNIKI